MAITLVQSKSGIPVSASATFTSNTTAGNCVVFGLTDSGGVTATSAAKLGGVADNFTKLEEFSGNPGGGNVLSSLWVDPGCAGGQNHITWTDTGTLTSPTYWIAEFTGIAAASVFDTGSTNSGATGSWSVGFTSTSAVELWLGAMCLFSGTGAGGAGNGWNFVNVTDPNSDTCVYGWQAVSSTGTATFSGTGASKSWGAAAAGVKGAATGIPNKSSGLNQAVNRAAVW